ncbi:MAG: Crp/Fnr family transcriptional regulator [Anaeromyxobacter sp.]
MTLPRGGDRRDDPRAAVDDLLNSAFFLGLPRAELKRMAARSELKVFTRGQPLWREGDPSTHIALVLTGKLKSIVGQGRRQVILDVSIRGDVLGDVAFALRAPLQSTVVAMTRAKVLLVPTDVVRAAFDAEPRALGSAMFSLARRVQRLGRLVAGLSAGSVTRRLAAVLLELAERSGGPFPGGILVPVRPRRSELASLAATSAESVSRQLAGWRRGGVLVTQPAGFVVPDLELLRRIAAGSDASAPRAAASIKGAPRGSR